MLLENVQWLLETELSLASSTCCIEGENWFLKVIITVISLVNHYRNDSNLTVKCNVSVTCTLSYFY